MNINGLKITIIMVVCQEYHSARLIELTNGIVDVTIPFTKELLDLIILVLKLNTNFCNNLLKGGMFKFTNISEALLYLGQFINLLKPLL